MRFSLLLSILFCLVSATRLLGQTATRGTEYHATADVNVPFAMEITKDDYQERLNNLASIRVELDREGILKILTRRLKEHGVETAGEVTFESIATELYLEQIEPKLAPKVKALDEMLNMHDADGRISVGFISFQGVAKAADSYNRFSVPIIWVSGYYEYFGDLIQDGKWMWNDGRSNKWMDRAYRTSINGDHRFTAKNSFAIDETFEFDLQLYGSDRSLTWYATANTELKIEQLFECDYISAKRMSDEVEATVRLQPRARIVATKTCGLGTVLKLTELGKTYDTHISYIDYPGVIELKVTPDEWPPEVKADGEG